MPRLRNSTARFKLLLLFLTLFSVWPTGSHALDYEKCVIVMFERDVMTLPEGLFQCSLDSASVSQPTIENILASNGASIVAALVPDFELADTLGVSRLGVAYKATDWSTSFLIEVTTAEYVDSLVADLQGVAGVVSAEPAVTPVSADVLPYAFPSPCINDPVFTVGDQWWFQNFGLDAGGQLSPGSADADIDLVEAWEITQGDTMTIAVLDEGVWGDHLDLVGKVRGRVPEEPIYGADHGTLLAGLIAAHANNSIAISGINPNAFIYSEEVYNDIKFFAFKLPDAVGRMRSYGIPIVNMSFSVTTNVIKEKSMRDAYNAGILLVASMTKSFRPPGQSYPAQYSAVLAVGETDRNDDVPDEQMRASWVDLVAPGWEVISLLSGESEGVAVSSGTSLSAPIACGVASLLLSVRPDLDNDDLREVMVRTADDLGEAGWDSTYGGGRLNAQRALEMVLFPNELYHASTQGNNYVPSTTYVSGLELHLPPATYWNGPATRYEVRRDVTFPVTYGSLPEVWGRGVPTDGYSTNNPNYAWRFCEVVPGSVTTSGCTLRTYVYERLQSDGTPYPDPDPYFTPCKPEDVEFAYTVVGRGDHQYRIQSFVRKIGTSSLSSMPENWALGCPGGDNDTLIVKVALDASEFEDAPEKEDFTLSQPHNARGSLFPDCTPRIADYDAVLSIDPEFPNGCYKTSFSIASFGGMCGVDSLRVRFRGGLLGYVPINIRSPDMIAGSLSRAKVSLADFNRFSEYYPSPPKTYNEIADFVSPTGVGLGDYNLMIYHYAYGGHQYTPPSLRAGDDETVYQGNAVLELSEGVPVEGQRTLVATVQLEAPSAYDVALVAFRCNSVRLELLGWEQAPSYEGETICSRTVVGNDQLLAVCALGGKNIGGACAIGTATFKVLGEDSLTLDEGEFDAVIADILLSDGVEGPLSAALVDRPEPKLANSLRQNFPNPFNPETTIIYSVKVAGKVTLAVYDVAGRRVRQLVDANRMPGNYRIIWDGTDSKGNRAASGIYFCRMVTGSFSASKKMVMLK